MRLFLLPIVFAGLDLVAVHAALSDTPSLGLENVTSIFNDEKEQWQAVLPREMVADIVAPDVDSPVSDPNNIPTLEYNCAILPQICANAENFFMQRGITSGTDGAYSTVLHYNPSGYSKRRNIACPSPSGQACKAYYSCDSRYKDVDSWRTTCDEFPFAAALEGGANAVVRCVSPFENNRQGKVNMMIGSAKAVVPIQSTKGGSVSTGTATQRWFEIQQLNPTKTFSNNIIGQVLITPAGGGPVVSLSAMPRKFVTMGTFGQYTLSLSAITFVSQSTAVRCACPTHTTTGTDGHGTLTVRTDCYPCLATMRPPFNSGTTPPGGTGAPLRRAEPAFLAPTPAPTRTPSLEEAFAEKWVYGQDSNKAALVANVVKRQDDSCPLPPEEPPEDEAEDEEEAEEEEAEDAQDDADSLADDDKEKGKAETAAEDAEELADDTEGFLDGVIGEQVVQADLEAVVAAAAAMDLNDAILSEIHNLVTEAGGNAKTVMSIASVNHFTTCASSSCSFTGTSPPPPPMSTPTTTSKSTATTSHSTTSTSSKPTGTSSSSGRTTVTTSSTTKTTKSSSSSSSSPTGISCLAAGMKKTIGQRVPEARPSGSCYNDANVTVESVPDSSTMFRFFEIVNGTKGYWSYAPENNTCGILGRYNFIATSAGPVATAMQWKPDCATGRMTPYYNGAFFPSLGVELGIVFPIGSTSQAVLDCYRNMLSIRNYPDMYHVFLDWSAENVTTC